MTSPPATSPPATFPPATSPVPVVVSGLGMVTGFGSGVDTFWRRLIAGDRAMGALTRFDAAGFRSTVVAQADVDVPPGALHRQVLSEHALAECFRTAGLVTAPPRTLLVLMGPVPYLDGTGHDAQAREISTESDWVGEGFPLCPDHTVYLTHACASGVFGLALAREWLLCGLADLAVVAGVFSLNMYDYAALDVLRALSRTGARPFDRNRTGVTVGEGAGAVIVETAAHAAARGCEPLAVLRGVACRVGGAGATDWNPAVIADCMRAALVDAGLTSVDYVHAHATGTRHGDDAELAALEAVGAELGWAGIPASSHKGAVGHLLYASAFPGMVAAVGALRDAVLPGTPGLENAAKPTYVRLLRTAEPRDDVQSVLVNSFGFGGNNASLVVGAVSPG